MPADDDQGIVAAGVRLRIRGWNGPQPPRVQDAQMVTFDHCVIAVTDWQRSNTFYAAVTGAEVISVGNGYAYRFGGNQLNVHGPGVDGEPNARPAVTPGGADLCFVWDSAIEDAVDHLERHGVTVELGPVPRFGAGGEGYSVYFRDPDGSLLEFISYG